MFRFFERRRIKRTVAAAMCYTVLTVILYAAGWINLAAIVILLLPLPIAVMLRGRPAAVRIVRKRFSCGKERFAIVDYYPLLPFFQQGRRALENLEYGGTSSIIPLGGDGWNMFYLFAIQFLSEQHFRDAKKEPGDALVLGVAGGALPRYLLSCYRNCRVTGVELSEELIAEISAYFLADLPADRFELIFDDALEFVRRPATRRYDVIFCDLFSCSASLVDHYDEGFADGLSGLLADGGIVLFNLQSADAGKLDSVIGTLAERLGFCDLLIMPNGALFLRCGSRAVMPPFSPRSHGRPRLLLRKIAASGQEESK